MARLAVGLGVIWLLLLPRATHGQRCAEPHYRWSEKVDTALATRPATPALISEILTAWAPPSLTSNDGSSSPVPPSTTGTIRSNRPAVVPRTPSSTAAATPPFARCGRCIRCTELTPDRYAGSGTVDRLPRPRRHLQRRHALALQLGVERGQVAREHPLPPSVRRAQPLPHLGERVACLLGGLPIGALHRGLEAGELVPRVAHRPREAVRHVLERRDRSPRRPIERASPEAAQLALKTPKTAVEHLLCHRIPDLEREPQLAGESGIRDVYSWIQLDSQRLRVRLPPDAQPH